MEKGSSCNHERTGSEWLDLGDRPLEQAAGDWGVVKSKESHPSGEMKKGQGERGKKALGLIRARGAAPREGYSRHQQHTSRKN